MVPTDDEAHIAKSPKTKLIELDASSTSTTAKKDLGNTPSYLTQLLP